MITRRILISLLVGGVAISTDAFASSGIALKILRHLKTVGKPALAISTSLIAGVASAKVMKELEHAHDDSPMLHVFTYYALISENRINDAMNLWQVAPKSHFQFMKMVDDIFVLDIKEINRTLNSSDVFVALEVKQFGRKLEEWRGDVKLVWVDGTWLISAMYIKKRSG